MGLQVEKIFFQRAMGRLVSDEKNELASSESEVIPTSSGGAKGGG